MVKLRGALVALAVLAGQGSLLGETQVIDLLEGGADRWRSPDLTRWSFVEGEIRGATPVLDGAITSPEASAFLVSKSTFGGDIEVSIDITFEHGRYLGVYLDYGQETHSGIWMATGHPLPEDPAESPFEVETAYIKTVEASDWTVRTRGELPIEPGKVVRLKFVKKDDDYSVWHDGRLIVTYHKPGYSPGPLMLRLTNARARIHRLHVATDWSK